MLSNDDSIEERQENEIQALKAIFNDDLLDLRSDKPWQPLDIVLTLSPQQGNSGLKEIHAQVDLHIICSKHYPNKEPEIILEKSRGISDSLLKELKQQLLSKAVTLKGEVMIFELAQHVQSFLHDHNKPSYKSFYEEMLQQKQLQLEAKQLEEDRKRKVIQNEIHRRQEILRSETKQTLRKAYISSESDKKISRKKNSFSDNTETILCEHKGTELIEFDEKKIQKGKCLSHSDRGCVLYTGLDLNTGELVLIQEWRINIKNTIYVKCGLKQVNSFEQEFVHLLKMRHFNLVKYLNMKYIEENNQIVVLILQEFIFGTNCNALFIKENISVEVDMLRYIASEVLKALDFLHRNNIVHKELRDSCVFIDNNSNVKVSGYSIETKLWELTTQTHINECNNKKMDIFKFGLFLLSLLKGVTIDKNNLEIPFSLPQDLFDFLSKCLVKEEKNRFCTTQLLQHSFIRVSMEKHRLLAFKKIDLNSLHKQGKEQQQQSFNIEKELDEQSSIFVNPLFHKKAVAGVSRIQNEFEVLQWLGRGAFGDVLKVRNKLDGGYYAIKRIKLNPKNRQLNRKITREVKLLSRLNHENVVRYYNSWIESAIVENDIPEQYEQQTQQQLNDLKNHQKPELSFANNIELLAPPITNENDVEWSVSESYEKHKSETCSSKKEETEENDDYDNEESSDEEWINFLPNDVNSSTSDSESIEFEKNSSERTTVTDSENVTKRTDQSQSINTNNHEIQFMYIQMEFCEKSTLRNAIDNKLYLDVDRVWRLFREIIEGLAHIHQQGMIHRDLKPVNIFLDLNDHVKIGDFGLATTNIINRQQHIVNNADFSEREGTIQDDCDSRGSALTGDVGTALYVAPELSTSKPKAIYNQKVDIYSLGIILFEMCYHSCGTGMERIKVLTGIRNRDIIFPSDFTADEFQTQRSVISMLLTHDVNKRPTSQQLLQSDKIPPPILEECELRELLRHTLNNPQSKAYKYLIASCFDQEQNYIEDITFDMNLNTNTSVVNSKLLYLHDMVKDVIIKIFKLHGGQFLTTPLLMPKSHFYNGIESYVKLMTHSGYVVSIPHDLRVSFARYVVWNNITTLKRYSIERVYREKKIYGFHPRELYECAFDIVTPNTGNFIADAELLSIICEIIYEFPELKNKNFVIRLNHTSLLEAILLHCGIPCEKHCDIYSIFSDARNGKVSKFQIRTHLISLCLTENAIMTLFNLLETEAPLHKVEQTLRNTITKRKQSRITQLANQGLIELRNIIQNAEALGVKCNINVALGLMYNIQQYSGMICQFICEMKKKKKKRDAFDVLAAGGRYDCMLKSYRLIMEKAGTVNRTINQTAVGISLSLDKFIQALQEEHQQQEQQHHYYQQSIITGPSQNLHHLDVAVCSLIGSKPMIKEKSKILREFWSSGIRCSLIEMQTLEEIQDLQVPHLIILNEGETNVARVQSWEKDRFQERKICVPDLLDHVQKNLKQNSSIYCHSNNCAIVGENSNFLMRNNSNLLFGSSFCSSSVNSIEHFNNSVVINFVSPASGKLNASSRKRYENQILSQMETTLQKLSSREQIVVLALNVESCVIKTLASYLDLESDELLQKSMAAVIERHPRHKKYLSLICDEILDYSSDKVRPIISLYSLNDNMFKLLI